MGSLSLPGFRNGLYRHDDAYLYRGALSSIFALTRTAMANRAIGSHRDHQ